MGSEICLTEYLKVTNGVASDIFTALEVDDNDMGFSIIMNTPDIDLTQNDVVIRTIDFKEFKVDNEKEIGLFSGNKLISKNTLYSLQEIMEETEFSYTGRI